MPMPEALISSYKSVGRTSTEQTVSAKTHDTARGSHRKDQPIESFSSSRKCDSAPRQPDNTGAASLHKKIPFLAEDIEVAPVTSRSPIGTIQCPDTFVKINLYGDGSVDKCPQGPCPCYESEEVKPLPVREVD